jgi:hypothetical protein
VLIKKSVFPDYIVCLEDGKKLKMLKRHLQTSYGLSPDAYRSNWGLARDYPMVAPTTRPRARCWRRVLSGLAPGSIAGIRTGAEVPLRGLQDGQHGRGSAEELQSAMIGGHVLVGAGTRAEEVAQFVIATTEPGG